MFTFASTDFRRVATATAGALLLSTVCIGAAVGPAATGAGIVGVSAAAPMAVASNDAGLWSKAGGAPARAAAM